VTPVDGFGFIFGILGVVVEVGLIVVASWWRVIRRRAENTPGVNGGPQRDGRHLEATEKPEVGAARPG